MATGGSSGGTRARSRAARAPTGARLGYAGAVRHAGHFFVHHYAGDRAPEALPGNRPQGGTPITDDMVPPRGDPRALGDPALPGRFLLGRRDYVLPGSHLGPESSKVLPPRLLAFAKG